MLVNLAKLLAGPHVVGLARWARGGARWRGRGAGGGRGARWCARSPTGRCAAALVGGPAGAAWSTSAALAAARGRRRGPRACCASLLPGGRGRHARRDARPRGGTTGRADLAGRPDRRPGRAGYRDARLGRRGGDRGGRADEGSGRGEPGVRARRAGACGGSWSSRCWRPLAAAAWTCRADRPWTRDGHRRPGAHRHAVARRASGFDGDEYVAAFESLATGAALRAEVAEATGVPGLAARTRSRSTQAGEQHRPDGAVLLRPTATTCEPVLEAVTRLTLERVFATGSQQADDAVARAQEQVAAADAALTEFGTRTGVADAGRAYQSLLTQLNSLESRRADALASGDADRASELAAEVKPRPRGAGVLRRPCSASTTPCRPSATPPRDASTTPASARSRPSSRPRPPPGQGRVRRRAAPAGPPAGRAGAAPPASRAGSRWCCACCSPRCATTASRRRAPSRRRAGPGGRHRAVGHAPARERRPPRHPPTARPARRSSSSAASGRAPRWCGCCSTPTRGSAAAPRPGT